MVASVPSGFGNQARRVGRSQSGARERDARCGPPSALSLSPMAERLLAIGADGARGGCLTVACYGESRSPVASRRTDVSLCPTIGDVVALRSGTDAPKAITKNSAAKLMRPGLERSPKPCVGAPIARHEHMFR
jgi:hypothetical protein